MCKRFHKGQNPLMYVKYDLELIEPWIVENYNGHK